MAYLRLKKIGNASHISVTFVSTVMLPLILAGQMRQGYIYLGIPILIGYAEASRSRRRIDFNDKLFIAFIILTSFSIHFASSAILSIIFFVLFNALRVLKFKESYSDFSIQESSFPIKLWRFFSES